MPIISAIVAISQETETLQRCLESVMQQSLQDFECLCVSLNKEETPAFIKNLTHQDQRFRLIQTDNPIQNIWEAYNIALKQVRGSYVIFINPADLLHKEMMSILFDSVRYSHADLVFTPNSYFSSKRHLKSLDKHIPFDKGVLKKKTGDLLESALKNSLMGMTFDVEGKLFNFKSLNSTRFRHNLSCYTPFFFMEQFLINASKIVYMKYPVYFMRQEAHIPALANFESIVALTKRCLTEKEYFIDSNRLSGYNVLLLKRKNSQEIFTALKQFILNAPDGVLICTHQQILALINQLKEKDFMQGLSLTFIQKIILNCLAKNKIATAKKLLRFF